MMHGETLEQLASRQMLRREIQNWALQERNRPSKVAPVLTISRDHCCGAEGIARALAWELGWKLYDREIVDRIADERKVSVGRVEGLDESVQTYLQEWADQVFSTDYIDQAGYKRGLVHVLRELAREGKAIIMGRGANFLIPENRRLAVRLTAPLSWRSANYAAEFGIREEEARRVIEGEDRRRRAFIESAFRKDLADPRHYDIVLNTSALPPETAIDIILRALGGRFA